MELSDSPESSNKNNTELIRYQPPSDLNPPPDLNLPPDLNSPPDLNPPPDLNLSDLK